MILSILATVAVLAAIATIAAALFLAETTLVYFALGLGGISVLLLLAALIQGAVRAGSRDRKRTGTDGLGKSSVPAVDSTAATPPGAHSGPEDSGRAPAPARQPVRDSVVSEHGSTGFTPVTGDWPETATGSLDPDPARPYDHVPTEDVRPAPEPEPFDYRIPHQGRAEDHLWAAEPQEPDTAPEPRPQDAQSFSGWATTRTDEPTAAEDESEEHVLPAPADETHAEGVAPDATDEVDPDSVDAVEVDALAEADTEEPVAEEPAEPAHPDPDADDVGTVEEQDATHREEFSGEEDTFDGDEPDDAPTFNYRVPTADASEDVEEHTDHTVIEAHDEPAPTEAVAAEEDVEPIEHGDVYEAAESDADEGAFSYRVPTADAVEPTGSGADGSPAFSYRVPGVDADEALEPLADQASAFAYRVSGADDDESAELTEVADADETVEADASAEAAEDSDADVTAWTEEDAEETATFSYRMPGADADESAELTEVPDADEAVQADASAELAEDYDTNEAVGTEGVTDEADASAEVAEDSGADVAAWTEEDAEETATFSYRMPGADADESAELTEVPDADEAVEADASAEVAEDSDTDEGAETEGVADVSPAFTYRVPMADTDEHSPVAYAAILDPDDEPSGHDSSRGRDSE